MTTLITGGCGFIGSHLASHLLERGESVIVVDDLSTGKRENLSKDAQLVEADVVDPSVFPEPLESVDRVYHLAAIASVERARTEWYRAHQVNSGGMVNLLHSIVRSERRIPVVYASSAAVYGNAEQLPVTDSTPTHPLSAYGFDKLACEHHASLAAAFDIPTVGLRFFNVYGPKQDPSSPYSGVISIFLDRAMRGEDLSIYGDGLQSRDFVYVSDVVQTLYRAMGRLEDGSITCDRFNVGMGNSISINELAETVRTLTGQSFTIHHVNARDGDIRHSYCDNTRTVEVLGYRPEVTLSEGLGITCEALAA